MLFVSAPLPTDDSKQGLPSFIHYTLTEQFDAKKPMYSPIPRPWWDYEVFKESVFPPPVAVRLPAKLLMVCKGLRRFQADFYCDRPLYWTVSGRFLEFLHSHKLLTRPYEQSELTIVSTSQKLITEQPYYLLRLFEPANDLVDFAHTTKLVSPVKPFTPSTPPRVYYTHLAFQPDAQVPSFFYLDDPDYFYSFFCAAETKQAMEAEKFLGFDFYTLDDYAQMRIAQERRRAS